MINGTHVKEVTKKNVKFSKSNQFQPVILLKFKGKTNPRMTLI